MTPYYSASGITIYHGDNRELLPSLADLSSDVLVTDPPYGVGKAEWDGAFPREWIPDALRVSRRGLVMTGNSALMEAGRLFGDAYRDCIVLHAINGMTRSPIAFGNWIPTLAVGDWDWKARPNYLRFSVATSEVIPHPSPKPIAALRILFHHYVEPGWSVLDPFMGSGTTLLVAKERGHSAIGIEREEAYCEFVANRLSQEVLALA